MCGKSYDMTAVKGTSDREAREERIDRLMAEFDALQRKNQVIIDEWRAKGILPPEEPRRRI
jgi:hypothetical protein